MPIFFDILRQTIAFIPASTISGGGTPVDTQFELLPVTIDGQTSFALSQAPTVSINLTKLFVNGVKMARTIDYTISGTTLNFVSTRFSLKTTDRVEFYYG